MFAVYGERLSAWDGPGFDENHRRYVKERASQFVLPPTPLKEAQRIRAQASYNALTNRNRLEPVDQTKAREASKPPTAANIIGKQVADHLMEARNNVLHEEPPKDSGGPKLRGRRQVANDVRLGGGGVGACSFGRKIGIKFFFWRAGRAHCNATGYR